ncbi:MAG: VOC family protein [Ancalomicrobiaceae bacterium]|nr:VOC family protein [Ancalomicrobiaceae bacterium]
MDPRITLVTLGVADVARASAFYERLGFQRSAAGNEHVAFFQLGPMVLSVFGQHDLIEDACLPADQAPRPGGITLAHNVDSPEAVDRVLAEAVAAGATLLKPGRTVFWGGYSGYFADPDGHPWEVAHNPFFPLDAAGQLRLPD